MTFFSNNISAENETDVHNFGSEDEGGSSSDVLKLVKDSNTLLSKYNTSHPCVASDGGCDL